MIDYSIYTRRTAARKVREEAATLAFLRTYLEYINNGEESDYRNPNNRLSYVANYSKALPHRRTGEVVQAAYRALLGALDSGEPESFERIPLGRQPGLNLINPQAGLAFDLEGPDAQGLTIPPAPRIDSPENSAEMAELYWMALVRDVSFVDYGTNLNTDSGTNRTQNAVDSLNTFSDFRGPKEGTPPSVTIDTLFRGFPEGALLGPYLSQFLLIGNEDADLGFSPEDGFIKYGSIFIDQRLKTAASGIDHLTRFEAPPPGPPSRFNPPSWLAAQNGFDYKRTDQFDTSMKRFIRNLRDLATYVHFDALYEAYLNACLIMLNIPVPPDPGNPYVDSKTQDGFGTLGDPNILSLVCEVATRALKTVWYQKWFVHRRLRPEEFGGRIHVHLQGLPARPGHAAVPPGRYPMIDGEILNTGTAPPSVLDRVQALNIGNSFLLPQAFPEGAPTHPAYGAGHATVAGACVTVLKAWFDESFILPGTPLISNRDGTALVPAPAGTPPLTVGGELDKLAANIALGRNAAGVHWRSDYTQSVLLGEQIAIGILQEQKLTYNEDYHLSVTKFDGTSITI
jgi:hypothetical protein